MNNSRIEKDFFFQTALHFEGMFHINAYDLTLSMLVETDSIREQNIAMERIEYFIRSVIQDSVLVHGYETDAMRNYCNSGIRVCEIPEQPYDQIVTMVLLQKLNAITEGRLVITDVSVGSSLSDGVRYSIISEAAVSSFSGNYWWNRSDISITNEECPRDKAANIVKLFNHDPWSELGLVWKDRSK